MPPATSVKLATTSVHEPATAASAPKTSTKQVTAASRSKTETEAVEPTMVIRGDELPSAYGAPGGFSRSRFSTLTNAYVLPPGGVFAALIYEGDAFMEGKPDHVFTQEVEVGLPYRFGLAVENSVERFNGDTENSSFSVEGRWALADWNKIPLNPTLFAEDKFGTGRILHEEGPLPPPEEAEEEEGEGPPDKPDAYEFASSFHRTLAITWSGLSTPFSKRKTPVTAAGNGVSRRVSRCHFFFPASASKRVWKCSTRTLPSKIHVAHPSIVS